jgi:hypothetical protein
MNIFKYIISFFCLLGINELVFSQNTATDFYANDCDGNAHHLFSELDSGKVVVMVWVMPCGPCASYALDAYSAVESYATSNPNQVLFYLVDDYANTTCQSLHNWANNFGMGSSIKFSDPSIKMSDYGQNGMPKIVVVGGANHGVYFNQNSSTTGIENAIDQALLGLNTILPSKESNSPYLFPNPSNGEILLITNGNELQPIEFQIYSTNGKLMIENTINQHEKIKLDALPNGNYILRFKENFNYKKMMFNLNR